VGLVRHPRKAENGDLIARSGLQEAQLRADPVPHFLPEGRQRLDRADHDLEFDHFTGLCEFDEVDAFELPFADIGGKFQRGVVGDRQ